MSKLIKLGNVAHETRNSFKRCLNTANRDFNLQATVRSTCSGINPQSLCVWAATSSGVTCG